KFSRIQSQPIFEFKLMVLACSDFGPARVFANMGHLLGKSLADD
ncbi:8229_t:CDS:1, partial [Cetraspora pellucida]